MVLNIAICDDRIEDIEELKRHILNLVSDEQGITFHEFLRGEDLLDNYGKFDAVFLDIQMCRSMNGMQAAEKIRLRDPNALIAFYTAYDYPASNIIKIHPFSYLIKNSASEEFAENLRRTLKEAVARKEVLKVPVRCEGKSFVLVPIDILYISILDKGTAVYLTDERIAEMNKFLGGCPLGRKTPVRSPVKIAEYYGQLQKYGFIYAKKSYIINAWHIKARLRDSVLLSDGTELTVARSKKKQFDDELSAYWSMQYRKENV